MVMSRGSFVERLEPPRPSREGSASCSAGLRAGEGGSVAPSIFEVRSVRRRLFAVGDAGSDKTSSSDERSDGVSSLALALALDLAFAFGLGFVVRLLSLISSRSLSSSFSSSVNLLFLPPWSASDGLLLTTLPPSPSDTVCEFNIFPCASPRPALSLFPAHASHTWNVQPGHRIMVPLLRESHSEHLAVLTVSLLNALTAEEQASVPVAGVWGTDGICRWLPGVEGMGVLRWTRGVALLVLVDKVRALGVADGAGVVGTAGVEGGPGVRGRRAGVGVVSRSMVESMQWSCEGEVSGC